MIGARQRRWRGFWRGGGGGEDWPRGRQRRRGLGRGGGSENVVGDAADLGILG